jgi:hypothetical protein
MIQEQTSLVHVSIAVNLAEKGDQKLLFIFVD